jgi:hypothetical protein
VRPASDRRGGWLVWAGRVRFLGVVAIGPTLASGVAAWPPMPGYRGGVVTAACFGIEVVAISQRVVTEVLDGHVAVDI